MGLPICATCGENYRQNPLTGVQLQRDPVTKLTSVAGVQRKDIPPDQLGGGGAASTVNSLTPGGLSAVASVGSVVPSSVLGAYK